MPRFAANLSMMFNEIPFLDRFAAARRTGFEGVEFLFPYEFPATVLRERRGQGIQEFTVDPEPAVEVVAAAVGSAVGPAAEPAEEPSAG